MAEVHAMSAERTERERRMERERQRRRRTGRVRIVYYSSHEVAAVIDSLRHKAIGGDASSILNKVVIEWARNRNL